MSWVLLSSVAGAEEGMVSLVIALIALTAMEIVLGIDNVVFISVVTARLPPHQQDSARRIGLIVAMVSRVLLLLTITWIMRLTQPIFSLSDLGMFGEWFKSDHHVNEVTWKDLIMLGGGLFLIRSSVVEIHAKVAGDPHGHGESKKGANGYWGVIGQIALLDIIFSLDSVITAVGMARNIWVMVTAVICAVGAMMVFSGSVAQFVEKNPTVKVLALSFLLLIGVMLVAEGLGREIPKGYIYFAMGFSLGVEVLNLRAKDRAEKLAKLHGTSDKH